MIGFDSALDIFIRLLIENLGSTAAAEGFILRDIYGRLSFITASPRDQTHDDFTSAAAAALEAWCEPKAQIVISLSDDATAFSRLLEQPWQDIDDRPGLRLIDRRLAGDDWLMRPQPLAAAPVRLIFYSVKGGVGRSTALAVAAADFAARGFNVLVVDLDLEAPGLGSLLLRPEDMPGFGVTDWLAAVAAGADADALIADMAGASPFTSARSLVEVIPAAGRHPGAYLSKLARAYTPGSAGKAFVGFSFPRKIDALLTRLTSRQRYDVILIDARAGLHETSGALIFGLGAKSLLFGIDTVQTFDDFRLLFDAFRQAFAPARHGEDLRLSLRMVHAKAPRDAAEQRRFRERSWEIWSDMLYDDVEPNAEWSGSSLVFDLDDAEAPHYPLVIVGEDSYARFDPRTETYPLSAEAYRPVFGRFLAGVRVLAGLT